MEPCDEQLWTRPGARAAGWLGGAELQVAPQDPGTRNRNLLPTALASKRVWTSGRREYTSHAERAPRCAAAMAGVAQATPDDTVGRNGGGRSRAPPPFLRRPCRTAAPRCCLRRSCVRRASACVAGELVRSRLLTLARSPAVQVLALKSALPRAWLLSQVSLSQWCGPGWPARAAAGCGCHSSPCTNPSVGHGPPYRHTPRISPLRRQARHARRVDRRWLTAAPTTVHS